MPFINTVHRVSLFYRVEADVMPVNSTGVDTASCISFSAGYEFRRTHPPPVFLLLSAFPADFITRLLWNYRWKYRTLARNVTVIYQSFFSFSFRKGGGMQVDLLVLWNYRVGIRAWTRSMTRREDVVSERW